jgi:hypothetical protein
VLNAVVTLLGLLYELAAILLRSRDLVLKKLTQARCAGLMQGRPKRVLQRLPDPSGRSGGARQRYGSVVGLLPV